VKIRNKNISLLQIAMLVVFYGFLRYLPSSSSYIGGRFFRYLRYHCCRHIFLECGKYVNVERGAYFSSGTRLRIGDNSGLGVNCHVPADISIGKNVLMGPNCYILGANHAFSRTDIPIINQGFESPRQTVIKDDVWIGRDVCFTPGRIVSNGTIIGARCVLTKDFPEFSVVGGNPSKLIRDRMANVNKRV
jgi:maltose O-acetyltransferase